MRRLKNRNQSRLSSVNSEELYSRAVWSYLVDLLGLQLNEDLPPVGTSSTPQL